MKQKALIVDSTRLFQSMLEQILSGIGVECHIYSSATEALEASHDEYGFILVARTLNDMSGDLFLRRYSVKHGLGEALNVLLTTEDNVADKKIFTDSGFKLIFNKKNLQELQDLIVKILNTRTLDLDANILFVEDSRSVADAMCFLLNQHKANVVHVDRLSDMRKVFDENDFDLVISDYYLHNTETADEVIAYVRNHGVQEKTRIPIMIISAESNQAKRTSFLRNGADDFIIKPYDNDEMMVRASNLIRGHRLYLQTKQQQQQMLKMAMTDQLTRLFNRHSLYEMVPKYISDSRRSERPLSLLVIDLDHFKSINDGHGHNVGDQVLMATAEVMKSYSRTEDMVARFGGEEFVMLLSNCNQQNAASKAETLRKMIEELRPGGIPVTTSIGVAQLQREDNFDSLFERADKAVYEAKSSGRNRVVVH